MIFNITIFLIWCILILTTIAIYYIYYKSNQKSKKQTTETFKHNYTPIHCIMITGKNKCRLELARKSVQNFKEQSYPNKYMLILNHGDTPVLTTPDLNIKEVVFKKEKGMSLGYLRNVALSYIPEGHIWTTWDDDDYRNPKYLDILHKEMLLHNATTILFTHRLECNINTHFVWSGYMRTGYVTLLSIKKKQDDHLYSADKDTMEDLDLKKKLVNNGHTFHVMQFNNPKMYIRMVHNNNTSLYVNKHKTDIRDTAGDTYIEFNVNKELQKDVLAFFLEYYKKGIQCMKLSEKLTVLQKELLI